MIVSIVDFCKSSFSLIHFHQSQSHRTNSLLQRSSTFDYLRVLITTRKSLHYMACIAWNLQLCACASSFEMEFLTNLRENSFVCELSFACFLWDTPRLVKSSWLEVCSQLPYTCIPSKYGSVSLISQCHHQHHNCCWPSSLTSHPLTSPNLSWVTSSHTSRLPQPLLRSHPPQGLVVRISLTADKKLLPSAERAADTNWSALINSRGQIQNYIHWFMCIARCAGFSAMFCLDRLVVCSI